MTLTPVAPRSGMPAADDWLSRVLGHTSDMIIVVGPDTRVLYGNPAVARILGYEGCLIGELALDVCHPEDRTSVALGLQQRIEDGGSHAGTRYRVRHADGSWRLAESIADNQLHNPAIGGVVITTRDVTSETAASGALAESEARYRTLVERCPTGILIHEDGVIRYANPAALSGLAASASDQVVGRSTLDFIDPGFAAEGAQRVRATQQRGEVAGPAHLRAVRVDGVVIDVQITSMPFTWEGRPARQVVLTDITTEHRSRRALAASEQRFRSAFHDLGTGMLLADAVSGRLVDANRELAELLGYGHDELVGRYWQELVHPADRGADDELLDAKAGATTSERRYVRKDGAPVWVAVTTSEIDSGEQRPLLLAQVQDVTERKRVEAARSFEATHDQLTGLPNRVVLVERLTAALERAGTRPDSVAVLFVDVDEFKLVNDGYGHAAGDQVIAALGQRLRRAVRPGDLVARFAGDEFVVLCEGVQGQSAAVGLAERLFEIMADPVVIQGSEILLTASIGIAFGGDGDSGANALLRDADIAMFEAKARGRARYTVFDETLRGQSKQRLEIMQALRRALDREELRLFYQPIMDLPRDTMVGVEALIRWEHPTRGLLSPIEFMPVAEQSGLMVSIGKWVIEEACRQAARWAADPAVAPIVMSVNLSARQLTDPHLVDDVAEALGATGLHPSLLCLELTESAVMEDPEGAAEVLRQLRDLGASLAIDDFGTGYSSLSYLRRLRVDHLKIDRSFIDGLGTEGEDTQIVTAVVRLAHELKLAVVAEGVETEAQLGALRALGCDTAQGYYFARPQPAADLSKWERFPSSER